METTLHRQLKELYAGPEGRVEHRVAGYRIDAVRDGQFVEIQHGGLSAIRYGLVRTVYSGGGHRREGGTEARVHASRFGRVRVNLEPLLENRAGVASVTGRVQDRREEDAWLANNFDHAQRGDAHEPERHDRSERRPDTTGAEPLRHEQHKQDHDR